MWRIFSPNKKLEIDICLDNKGSILYAVSLNHEFCAEGSLGIDSSLGDFRKNLQFVEQKTSREIRESYCLPAGKKETYENHCMETCLGFVKGEIPLNLVVRAYDNGAAFRYEIPLEGEKIFVKRESTDFCFPEEFDQVWLQNWVPNYEAPYNRTTWGPDHDGRHYGMPVLVSKGPEGPWIMINEAAVLNKCGDYCVSHVLGTSRRHLLLEFAPEEKGEPVPSSLPFQSPWRYLLIEENLDDVVNATLNYNLNPPSEIEDISWIKPARSLWAWWINDTGAQVYTEIKEYVDFAAAMGFEAVVVDAGWNETWIRHFCTYAHERNVSPWLWTAMQEVDTEEKANYYFPLWKSWGIDGVKIDIFENDSAHTAWQYSMMARLMAREKLMVNFHGCTKPMGEGRTWPHLIAAEGIMGLEYYKWSDVPNAEHNCTVPFIRNAAGPMDYTPTGFTNGNRNTSMAHQMALSAVFESGASHFAASIYNLEGWIGTNFLRRLKPKYDGLRLLSGYPGNHVAMLRWVKKTEEYVIGCICNQQRTQRLSLDFLPEGEFEAEIYTDDRFGDEILYEHRKVTKDSVLLLPMTEHGGAGVYIARKTEPLCNLKPEGYMCDKYIEISCKQAYPRMGSRHGVVSTERLLPVLNLEGSGEFVCAENLPEGNATIRMFYRAEEDFLLHVTDGISGIQCRVPPSGHGSVLSTYSMVFHFTGGPVKLIFERLQGQAPMIDKIRIIFNNPPQKITLPIETGILSGGGAFLPDSWGGWKLCGMEPGNTLCMENIMLSETGDYILRFHYYSGPTARAKIRINGEQEFSAGFAGISKWSSTKEGDLLASEILVSLYEGANTIELRAEQAMPDLKELVVIPMEE